MNVLYPIISVSVISLISLISIFTLNISIKNLKKFLIYFISFSAGSMIAGALFHMLPEVIEQYGYSIEISIFIILGILFSFILEKIICWRHCHMPIEKGHVHIYGIMNLVGDAIHNFIDGVIIGITFMLDTALGIATSIAVIFHEIPQEIADFGVLVHSGFTRKKAIIVNFIISLSSFVGLFLALIIGSKIENIMLYVIPFAIGNFIYIANSDLIPELHKETEIKKSLVQILTFVLGIAFMLMLLVIFD